MTVAFRMREDSDRPVRIALDTSEIAGDFRELYNKVGIQVDGTDGNTLESGIIYKTVFNGESWNLK